MAKYFTKQEAVARAKSWIEKQKEEIWGDTWVSINEMASIQDSPFLIERLPSNNAGFGGLVITVNMDSGVQGSVVAILDHSGKTKTFSWNEEL